MSDALGVLAKLVAREIEMQRALAAVKPRALPPSGVQTFCSGGIADAELLEAWLARATEIANDQDIHAVLRQQNSEVV